MTRRKDGLWQESIVINGKRKYFYGHTKAEVLRKVQAYHADMEKSITVSDALDAWLVYKEPFVEYKTYEGYQAPIKRIKQCMGDEFAKDITPPQIQSFVNDLAAFGYKRTAVQRPLDILRMTFDYLITHEQEIRYNPCAGVRLPSGIKQQRREIASREDIAIVRNSLGVDFSLFAYLIMYTGLRDGEALALTSNDFKEGQINVNKSVSWQTNRPVIKSPKTPSAVRKVILLDPLRDALPKWNGYLFSADGGKSPLTNTEFRSRWNNYCKAAGLADPVIETHRSAGSNNRTYTKTKWKNRIVPYQLRHEFATMCFDAGLDPADVKQLMGHSSEAMAREIYTHYLESRKTSTAQKLNDFVNKQQ